MRSQEATARPAVTFAAGTRTGSPVTKMLTGKAIRSLPTRFLAQDRSTNRRLCALSSNATAGNSAYNRAKNCKNCFDIETPRRHLMFCLPHRLPLAFASLSLVRVTLAVDFPGDPA